MSENSFQNLLRLLILASALVLLPALIYHWQWSYNSDFAMIGLMAKRILEHGDPPLFVWKVGYQGTLLEANAVALIFKLFGISSYTLNLAPLFFYVLLLTAYYRSLQLSFDKSTALLATFFLIVCSPWWYASVLRTQPNYVETFLFGTVLSILYIEILKRIYLEGNRRADFLAGIFGALAGFAFYTYGQIIYFFGAIGLHLTLIYLRSARTPTEAVIISPPPLSERIWKRGLLSVAAFGIFTALANIQTLPLGSRPVRWSPVTGMVVAFASVILIHASAAIKLAKNRFDVGRFALITFSTFILGYFPKIYYNVVLHQRSLTRLSIGGTFSDWLARWRIGWEGAALQLNFDRPGFLHWFSLLIFVGFTGNFLLATLRQIVNFIARKGEDRSAIQISIFSLLPVPVLLFFSVSSIVVDNFAARYILALFLFYSLAAAFSLIQWYRKRETVVTRLATVLLALIFTFNCLQGFKRAYELQSKKYFILDVIDRLKEKKIHFAYGDYWYAYSLAFLTKEEIIVEPFHGNFHPDYEAKVKGQKRIAVLDSSPYKFNFSGPLAEIRGERYQITEQDSVNGVDIFVMEKL